MAYDVTLVEFNQSGAGGISMAGITFGGFPSTPFDYLLTSMWVCLPFVPVPSNCNYSVAWPFCTVQPNSGANTISLTLVNGPSSTTFFNGTYAVNMQNLRTHILISVNCVTQTVQVYVNDAPVALTSGGFSAAMSLGTGLAHNFDIDAGGTASGHFPAMADLWSANTPAFVDLSVTANRRKFINADLSPVDLGTTGTGPIGTQPPVYLTIPTGGVPSDFRTNHGTGASFTNTIIGVTLGFQTAGVCTLPPPPVIPPPTLKLAMDNVIATASQTLLPKNLISLRWSDDRAHTWGSPVTIPMGEAGEYLTSLQWQRLAYGRDRVFELSWDVPCRTALQGCWIDVTPAQS